MKILFTLTLILTLFKGCGETKDINVALDSLGIPSSAAEFKHDYRTIGGVTVKSTQELPQVALNAIDQGILWQIDRINHARPTWNAHNQLSQYYVLVIDPTAYSVDDRILGAPLIQLQGGTTAGTVIGIGGTRSILDHSYIVLPHQNGQNWRFIDYFREAVRNESEHDRECNEPNRQDPVYECEQFQGWNDVHPHFP
jgi:hypothetical protein